MKDDSLWNGLLQQNQQAKTDIELNAFSDLGRIHWHKTKPMNGVSVDDIVYIYIGVEVDEEWGRLKSGAGWICLDFVNRV